jgi:hypothetical protein
VLCQAGAVRWQGGVPHQTFMVWTARVLAHLIFCVTRLIYFYLFAYHLRLLARGIAMPLRCRHKPAMAGIRSKAIAQARQASERRPTPLPDGRYIVFVHYLLFILSTFFNLSYCSIRDAWRRQIPSISLRYGPGS